LVVSKWAFLKKNPGGFFWIGFFYNNPGLLGLKMICVFYNNFSLGKDKQKFSM